MESTVVREVIRIGRILVVPALSSASSNGIVCRYRLVESTNRMPLFTTMPISIRKPIMDTMLNVTLEAASIRKDPIRLKGIQIITIKENFGDSNCMAITYSSS